ncbi:MAG TPA: hypothetical protein VEW48_11070 [Thermoanaerobaculia bacterium]|nr:hypothetical protein [Thermoanaerobaculia bacterium]
MTSAAPIVETPAIAVPPPSVRPRSARWADFIALGGAAGRLWLAEYELAGGMELHRWTEEALELLRRRQLDAGLARLEQADALAGARIDDARDSIAHVMRRWYWAALAYLHYCRDDFELASQALVRAHDAVRAAVEAAEPLLPLAPHCHEFRIQHARIARSRRRWSEMWSHIEIARRMLEDREPLCLRSDGVPVHFADLARHYGRLSAYAGDDRKALAGLLTARYRLRYFELHVHWVYTPAGFTIPYASHQPLSPE